MKGYDSVVLILLPILKLGEAAVNGDETDAHRGQSSKEVIITIMNFTVLYINLKKCTFMEGSETNCRVNKNVQLFSLCFVSTAGLSYKRYFNGRLFFQSRKEKEEEGIENTILPEEKEGKEENSRILKTLGVRQCVNARVVSGLFFFSQHCRNKLFICVVCFVRCPSIITPASYTTHF